MKRDIYRTLRITHGNFGYDENNTYEEKCACIRARIEDLKTKGYGGIVTNVRYENYMKDPDEWPLMQEKVKVCKEHGLRLWLYDEDCYPSGAAGTQTLEADADYEARACAMVRQVLAPGESLTMCVPHGHEKLLGAVCYVVEGEQPTAEELRKPYARCNTLPVVFANDTEKNLLVLAFFQKRLYEGTHAQNNVAYRRRYIDVSNRDAMREFIRNTYERYTELLGENYAAFIGDEREDAVVEAIFTDEPSYQGVYINKGIACRKLIDEPDETIPLYPIVNWGRDTANRFAAVYGYRLEDELTALFLGHSEHFCRVRRDYYQLMSDLYEQAYFAQLSDYCARVGLNFSGHILLEDELPLHVMFEGNFFNLLRHMHTPGIDMLWSTPEKLWEYAFTPLLVRSIADLYDRGHVMDEVSAHSHGKNVPSIKEMYGALMLQFAFGADIFTSYYPDDTEPEGKKVIWDAISRAGAAMDGRRVSDTLLLYPIETMMRHRKPYQHGIENDRGYGGFREKDDTSPAVIRACNDAMLGAQYAMLDAQQAFTYTDVGTALRQCAGGWKNFVIGACDVTDELAVAAHKLAAGGCRIVWYCPEDSAVLAENAARLPAGTVIAATPEQLLAAVRPAGSRLSAETGSTAGIAFAETERCAILVNRDACAKALCWNGTLKAVVDASTGEELPMTADAAGVHFVLGDTAAVLLYKA